MKTFTIVIYHRKVTDEFKLKVPDNAGDKQTKKLAADNFIALWNKPYTDEGKTIRPNYKRADIKHIAILPAGGY